MKFRDQDFKTLLDEYLKSGSLFCDPTFAADQNSIQMPEDPDPNKAIKWLRPKVGYFSLLDYYETKKGLSFG